MKIKHLTAFFVMLFVVVSAGVCVSAANMTAMGEVNGSLSLPKNAAEAYKPYEYQIEMTDGNDKYTFKRPTTSDGFDDGIWPDGLTISETGLLSGTMTADGVFIDIRVLVISKEDNKKKVLKCKLTIDKRQVKAVVRGGTYPYDGQPHPAEAELHDMDGNKLDVKPIITYGTDHDVNPPVNVGTYSVNVTSLTGCTIVEPVTSSITITPIGSPAISIQDKSVPYTGQPQGIEKSEVTITPNAEFVIEYQAPGSTGYTETKPTASGKYSVRVRTTDRNMPVTYAYATFTIRPEEIDFTVTPVSVVYNKNEQEPSISPQSTEEIGYSVSYTDENDTPIAGKPIEAGTYNIIITFDNPDRYAVGSMTSRIFTIEPQEVTLKIPVKSYPYEEGKSYKPVVEPSIEGFDSYTVMYQLIDDESNPVGDPVEEISAMGTYNVIFTLTDSRNYKFGTGNAQSVQVATQTINFTFTDLEKEYNGSPQYATVTPDKEEFRDCYDVVYTQNGNPVAEPTAAGSYYITIRPKTGYGTGTKNPEYPYLTIAQKPITFTVTTPTVKYNGKAQKTTLSNSEDITTGYTVKYRDKDGNVSTEVTEAGEYDVLVEMTNSNYKLENSVVGKFTVETSVSLSLGNSPAAMIYSDVAHINEPEWQAAALDALVQNRKFSAEYVPAGCSVDILYNRINNIDLDGDKNTVIVNNINDFTDPGLMVNSTKIMGSAPVSVDGMDNLYKVTYTYEGTNYERYVMVVGKIGDTNGDGSVNAVDANKLDGLDRVPETVNEARVWDVNKDGKIDSKDAAAIRYRFRTKLTSYYPWVK